MIAESMNIEGQTTVTARRIVCDEHAYEYAEQ